MVTAKKSALVAVLGLAVLAGVLSWRALADQSAAAPADAPGAMSTPMTIEQMREAAEAAPDKAQNWQELGLALFNANRFDEAAEAYEWAVKADPESAILWSSLGEAKVMASRDAPLPAAAREAFSKALALDAADPRARYFKAVEKDLAGDHEGALKSWLALLADTPPGAPWEADLVRTIQQVGAIHSINVAPRIAKASNSRNLLPDGALAPRRGPTAEQIAAAGALSPSQQQDMAESMVARLAARLESEPEDVEGWIMLMRSYRQLGRDGDAQRARDTALLANPSSSQTIRDAAQSLGIS